MSEDAFDLAEFEVWLAEYRDSHRAGGPRSGLFSRTPRGELDALASADFAVIDYTLGPWPLAPSEQAARARILQDFQSPETGLFERTAARGEAGPARDAPGEAEADSCARTAYFASALELLGARPLHPLRALDRDRTPEGVGRLVEGVGSGGKLESVRRAGAVAACFAATGDVGPEWFGRLFDGLEREVDPKTGYWPRGAPGEAPSALEALSASLGFFALYGRFRRPLPDPGAVVTATLGLQKRSGLYEDAGPGRAELAAAVALDRAFRQSGRKFARVRAALGKLLLAARERLSDERCREGLEGDPHRTAQAVSLLAALSQALPGSVRARRPLRLYLERHHFV